MGDREGSAREKLGSCFRKDCGCRRQRKRRTVEVGPPSHDRLCILPEVQGCLWRERTTSFPWSGWGDKGVRTGSCLKELAAWPDVTGLAMAGPA